MGLGFRVEGFDFSLDLDLRWVLGWASVRGKASAKFSAGFQELGLRDLKGFGV